jgi:hypothetical protein
MMEGENLHAQLRKRYWRNLTIAGIGAAPIGFGVGWYAHHSNGEIDAFWSAAPDWAVIALLALAITALLFGSWRFYRSIDEVELLDNLWASSASYTAYILLFPTWWVLGKAGIAQEPNDWLIFFAALGSGTAFYLWRKWRAH